MLIHGLVLLGGYLIGSVSFTRLIARLLAPDLDLTSVVVRDEKTGATYRREPNATTVSMALGWKSGCLISLADMLKAVIPILILRSLFPLELYYLTVMIGVLMGNNWPLYYGFVGGSGLSVIYGGLLLIDPLAVLVTVVSGFFVGMIILRSMMLTFVLPMLMMIPWFWFRTGQLPFLLFALALNVGYFLTFARDVRQYLGKSKDEIISERDVMEQMPMGRGMLKMMDKLGLQKKR